MTELVAPADPLPDDSLTNCQVDAPNTSDIHDPSEIQLQREEPPQAPLVPPAEPAPAVPIVDSRLSNLGYKLLKLILLVAAVTLGVFGLRMVLSVSNLSSQAMQPNFEQYHTQFGKRYGSDSEKSYRQYVYYQRLQEIAKHNEQPNRSYEQGVNDFTDMTSDEFRSLYLLVKSIGSEKGYIRIDSSKEDQNEEDTEEIGKNMTFPDVNYVHLLPPIKNQYHCAGCYSFPITASVEALYAQKANNGTVYALSEQQLIDCASELGKGCSSGSIDRGFAYIIKNGISEEKDYRFRSKDGNSYNCSVKPTHKFKVTKLIDIPRGKCSIIERMLNTRPVVVKLDASNWGSYKEGIFDNCGRHVNHGLLVVGRTKEYWLVRNSWGKSWGEYGYIRLAKGNTCGLCDAASYPVLADGQDSHK